MLVGADHPIWAHGVCAYGQHVTSDVLSAAVAGQALGVVAAHTAGLEAIVVDAGVGQQPVAGAVSARPGRPRGDLAGTDALDEEDVEEAAGERATSAAM